MRHEGRLESVVVAQHLCGTLADDDAGAIVLPVVTRGMIEPSAMRRFSIPYTLSFASTTDNVVFLQHFHGNLDNWDPALVDDIAAEREVILVGYSGVGLSNGTTPRTVYGLARDALAFIDALDLKEIDLFGLL